MRIVAGRFRGASLATPRDNGIRPTSDRVREAIFNILTHGEGAISLEGARVLDLFAGTGAMGLEAVSRGAGYALFVEENAEARGLHPPQCRSAGGDRRHPRLPARCNASWRGGHAEAFRSGVR